MSSQSGTTHLSPPLPNWGPTNHPTTEHPSGILQYETTPFWPMWEDSEYYPISLVGNLGILSGRSQFLHCNRSHNYNLALDYLSPSLPFSHPPPSLASFHLFTFPLFPPTPGLLSLQNSPSLRDISGFDNLLEAGTIVVAFLRNGARVLDGFNSLFEASRIIITFNMVSD